MSVYAQDHKAVEHIIIDGKSSDSTVEMAEKYKRENDSSDNGHKVVIISEADNGLYDAMNKGIRLANGGYIVYLNAGDTFPNGHTLHHIVSVAEKNEPLPGVLFGDTDIVDKNGRFLRHRRLHTGGDMSWKTFRRGMLVCHQAFYAAVTIAKDTPYDTRYKYSADVDWCIRIMKKTEKDGRQIINVNQVVANYLKEGITTTHHKESLRERFLIMKHHYGLFPTVLFHIWFAVRAILK